MGGNNFGFFISCKNWYKICIKFPLAWLKLNILQLKKFYGFEQYGQHLTHPFPIASKVNSTKVIVTFEKGFYWFKQKWNIKENYTIRDKIAVLLWIFTANFPGEAVQLQYFARKIHPLLWVVILSSLLFKVSQLNRLYRRLNFFSPLQLIGI